MTVLPILTILLCLLAISSSLMLEYQAIGAHDPNCYTQGLFFLNDTHLFQSCGMYGQSFFHVLQFDAQAFTFDETYSSIKPWRSEVFLEGSVLFKGFIYVMSWREHQVYKIDPDTYEVVETLGWSRAGWGLTTNGTHMFATDGSDAIYLVDDKFRVLDKKEIKTETGRRLYSINELEYVGGYIYANIYTDHRIMKIDYEGARVVNQYDGSNIIKAEKNVNSLKSDQVFNGIAYHESTQTFIVTGKDWNNFYKVQL